MKGFSPWARQVPKREARVILVSVPCSERVPPLILRLTTKGRRLGWPEVLGLALPP